MNSIDEMSINDLIALYYEKHHAMRQGDMGKLIELKNKCPELFNKEKDAEIHDIIQYAKNFQASDHYKNLRRLQMKEKLSVISNDASEE